MSKKLQIVGSFSVPQSDWNQTDETKNDYIKNKPENLATKDFVKEQIAGIESGDTNWDGIQDKPEFGALALKDEVTQSELAQDVKDLLDQMDAQIADKADADHNHDETYDSKGAAETALASAHTYTDTKISGLVSTTTVDSKISAHNTSTSAHNDIRVLITDLAIKLNNFLDVDDTTTDQLSEVITLINNNKGTLESLTTSKVNVLDIVDNLITNSASKVLSAAQGVVIKSLIDALQNELNGHDHDNSYDAKGAASDALVNSKSYTDSIANGKANAEHDHEISDVSNLQTALDDIKSCAYDAVSDKAVFATTTTDTEVSCIKDVPSESATYAEVLEIGGATRKCTNLFDNSKVGSSITPTTTGFSFTGAGGGAVTLGRLKNLCPNVKIGDSITYYADVTNQYSTKAFMYIADADNRWSQGVFITATQVMLDSLINVYGVSGETCTFDNMRVVNAADTPYEPYFEGLRSAPVTEVESVGANLFDVTKATIYSRIRTDNGTVEMLPSSSDQASSDFIFVSPNTKYVLNFSYHSTADYGMAFYDLNKGYISGTKQSSVGKSDTDTPFVFTTPNNCYYIRFSVGGGKSYNDVSLNKGDTVLPDAHWGVLFTLTIPAEVQALEGYGEGINEAYHNFIRFDGEKRIYTQQVKRIVFDGTENWRLRSASNVESNYVSLNLGAYGTVITGYGKCSHYDRYNLAFTNTGIGFNVLNSNGYDAAMVTVRPWNGIASADEWKTYLAEQYAAGTPVTVVYALAEAEVTDITDLVSADNLLSVEAGGTVTMVNEYDYDVPNTITFYEGKNEVIGADTFVGDLHGTAKRAEVSLDVPDWAKTETKPTYTANEVGARPNTWMPTASDVGAAPISHSHSYNDLSDKPTIPAAYTHPTSHPASMITGLATVATSGKYSDLSDKPTIPTIPSSLPANGGNADTVDNKHASDFAASSHKHTKSEITDFPTSMPASDVYSWAKASSKPSYAWSEITGKPSTFTPAAHTHNYAGSSSAGGAANSANALNAIKIASGSDLNSFTTCGFYYVSSNADAASITNSPTSKAFFMIVGKHAGTYQEVVSYLPGNPARYMRNKNNNSWGDWFKVITSNTLADSLPAAGSSLGAVKTGGDVSIADGVITVNDDSHNHTIANVDGLQTALNGKAPAYTSGTDDLVAGSSSLDTGTLYFVYE